MFDTRKCRRRGRNRFPDHHRSSVGRSTRKPGRPGGRWAMVEAAVSHLRAESVRFPSLRTMGAPRGQASAPPVPVVHPHEVTGPLSRWPRCHGTLNVVTISGLDRNGAPTPVFSSGPVVPDALDRTYSLAMEIGVLTCSVSRQSGGSRRCLGRHYRAVPSSSVGGASRLGRVRSGATATHSSSARPILTMGYLTFGRPIGQLWSAAIGAELDMAGVEMFD